MPKYEKWTEVYHQLSGADQDRALHPHELEKLALACYLIGRDADCFHVLERAHQGYLDTGMPAAAVRCAFWLGFMLRNAGEKVRGSGWFARGERLLGDLDEKDCAEQGLLLIPQALGALSAAQAAKAQQLFEQVAATGERFQDADLIALGRLGTGQAMIQQGNIMQGIKLLDELLITIGREDLFPLVHGIVYCAAIETCRKVWDMERAQAWTAALNRWCETQPDLVPFRGECLVHRAEIFQFHGEWPKALEETIDACDLLTQRGGVSAAGEAYFRQAELHRLVGSFDKAEVCYHEAAKRGKNPQPGMALLRMAQGQYDAAETSIRNTLEELKEPKKRAAILPAVVSIMLAVGHIEEAVEAAKELCKIARDLNIPYLLATCAHCQGQVSDAKGHAAPALEQVQKALDFWNSLNLPYESACSRELKGRVYRKMQDKDNAEAELIAARWIFDQLGAQPDLERVSRLLNREHMPEMYGLSLRELQVLRLVASGKTNKLIADELFISERTVDRHVSNIFNKLGVSSRVEAATFALTNQMLENYQQ